ncbi:MAG: outer membrane lipoprotein-sorting protein [Pseudomonadota bacterium]
MKSYRYFLLTRVTAVLVMMAGQAAALAGVQSDPYQILATADLSRGSSTGMEWTIAVNSSENGLTQQRLMRLTAKDLNSLAEFRSPAKVRGQKLLMQDRNMWFIKPGLKKPVPIAPRQKLMGGASYGDIASTNYAGDYTVIAMSDGTAEGEDCFVLDLVARDKKTTYDRIRYWVSKGRGTGVKAIFYTVSGRPFKSAVFQYGNSIVLNGRTLPFVSSMTIRDETVTTDVTTLVYTDIAVKPVPDAAFNLNLLVR